VQADNPLITYYPYIGMVKTNFLAFEKVD